jgi:hypothetical protein
MSGERAARARDRDRNLERVRRLTHGIAAASVAACGVFVGLAASAPKHAASTATTTVTTTPATTATPTTTTTATPTTTTTLTTPAAAPTQTSSPPVATSGGS